jgi:hypothetical protein
MKTRANGKGGLRLRGRIWWILYRRDGKQFAESTKTGTNDGRSEDVALAMLRQRIAEEALLSCTRTITKGPNLRFSGQELNVLLRPIVYAFYRSGECLYVGSGGSLARPLDTNHHHRADLTGADELVIYPCLNREEARVQEARLIDSLHPILNVAGVAA